uniref:Uncharacterized protein n=1 Tax=Rhizophora mucronata TaxID=61149 RepID=A0A2P2P994_RHIMU
MNKNLQLIKFRIIVSTCTGRYITIAIIVQFLLISAILDQCSLIIAIIGQLWFIIGNSLTVLTL